MKRHSTACRLLALVAAMASTVAAARLEAGPASVAEPRSTLVLDLAAPRLRLFHGGALLREYSVDAVELGRPMTLFIARSVEPLVGDHLRTLETLDPEHRVNRPIIVPAAPGSDLEAVEIPPAPEDAIPAPERYRLSFGGELTLEIVAAGSAAGSDWRAWPRAVLWRLGEVAESISRRPEARIRLVMPRAEAGALYRSVPPSAQLIVQ